MLNEKHEIFICEYLVDLNATQAAIRAGYSEKTAGAQASRLLKNVNISRAIEEALAKRAEKIELTADWVLENLKNVAIRCQQAEKVLEWDHQEKQMVETGEYQFDSAGANRALELIGKHLGMFRDKIDIKLTNDVAETDVLAVLELAAFAKAGGGESADKVA